MNTASIIFQSAQLRAQSGALTARAKVATVQLRLLADGAVLARTQARRLRADASIFDELRRQSPVGDWRWPRAQLNALEPEASPAFVDGEIFDDEDLIARLNALGYQCDHCGGEEALVAVVRFSEREAALGICGDCYRQLSGLALGQVT
jgi:hypothetical protein